MITVQNGKRKLIAFFTSMIVYLILMLTVIIILHPDHFSLESFAFSLASGIMVISYGFYASNAYVHAKENKKEE
ncbi:MAG: hypothetical protein Q8933_00585 [Bacteroidota bacterium]|nr:hypothetical protein [Bacteroidota bacterium]MDP4195420.1 hypothetical protein [Bacteroidota bacterium]